MKTIGFYIQKGGVGKTSIAGLVSFALAGRKNKILCIDLDQQSNLTSWISWNKKIDLDMVDVILNPSLVHRAIIDIGPYLSLIGIREDTEDLSLICGPNIESNIFLLKTIIDSVQDKFDYCIIDFAPSYDHIEISGIIACTEVITVLNPSLFSVRGAHKFNKNFLKISSLIDHKVVNNKMVLNQVNMSFHLHQKITESYKENNDYELFIIPQDQNIPIAQSLGMDLREYKPRSRSLASIEAIVDKILSK